MAASSFKMELAPGEGHRQRSNATSERKSASICILCPGHVGVLHLQSATGRHLNRRQFHGSALAAHALSWDELTDNTAQQLPPPKQLSTRPRGLAPEGEFDGAGPPENEFCLDSPLEIGGLSEACASQEMHLRLGSRQYLPGTVTHAVRIGFPCRPRPASEFLQRDKVRPLGVEVIGCGVSSRDWDWRVKKEEECEEDKRSKRPGTSPPVSQRLTASKRSPRRFFSPPRTASEPGPRPSSPSPFPLRPELPHRARPSPAATLHLQINSPRTKAPAVGALAGELEELSHVQGERIRAGPASGTWARATTPAPSP